MEASKAARLSDPDVTGAATCCKDIWTLGSDREGSRSMSSEKGEGRKERGLGDRSMENSEGKYPDISSAAIWFV